MIKIIKPYYRWKVNPKNVKKVTKQYELLYPKAGQEVLDLLMELEYEREKQAKTVQLLKYIFKTAVFLLENQNLGDEKETTGFKQEFISKKEDSDDDEDEKFDPNPNRSAKKNS